MNECGHCSKLGVLLRCSGCKVSFYCNQQCQRLDWKTHKKICKLMKNMENENENDSDNEWYDKSKYLERINKLLAEYDLSKNKKNGMVERLCNLYPNNDVNKFVMDYIQYVEHMDDNKVYSQNMGDQQQCDLNHCIAIKREYRNRSEYDSDFNKRRTLYNGYSEEIEIAILQMMDSLHSIKYHLFDMGLRLNVNKEWKQQNIKQIINKLKEKRNRFNKIRKDRKCNSGINNKFVTKIFEGEKKGQNEEERKMATYSFGFKYYYHDQY